MLALKEWSFDPISSLVTVVLLPAVLYLLKLLLAWTKKWGGYILEGALYFLARAVRHSLVGTLTLRHYCRLQLASQSQFLYVPSRLDVRLPIDEVFVSLSLETQSATKPNYSQSNVLEAGNRIIVVGDPGSGKSSMVKWLLRDSCRSAIAAPSKSRLPILVELKNITPPEPEGRKEDWLYDFLQSEASKAEVYRMDECFYSYSQTSGLLVLLDGLDEVATTDYPAMEASILALSRRLARQSPDNTVVLTMRLQFYQQIRESYRSDFSSTMFLKPFTPSDIYEFLTRWPFERGDSSAVERVYKELTDRPTLREMCRNPLVLSMYVAEDQAAGSTLGPETRTEFYSKVTEELIIRRRLQQKKGATTAAPKLKEQRERILGRIAFNHLLDAEQPANLLRWVDATRVVTDITGLREAEGETLLKEIAKETGLITEEKVTQTFRFIHLTFCEFLAASEAVQGRESGWTELISAHSDFFGREEPHLRSRLVETIPFACGLLPRMKRTSALTEVAEMTDDRLLARSFLETKLYEHESWPQFVGRQEETLLSTPEKEWSEEWLQDLYLFNVVVHDATQCSQHLPAISVPLSPALFFQSLIGRQKDSLEKILSAYAAQDAAASFRLAELCGIDMALDYPEVVITNCDQKPFFDLACTQISRASDQRQYLWCSLLSEAALRSRIVAQWMCSATTLTALTEELEVLPRRTHWDGGGLVAPSLLTQCISLAHNKGRAGLPLLESLRYVDPPGSSKLTTVLGMMVPFLFFLASFVLYMTTEEGGRSHSVGSLLVLITFLPAYLVAVRSIFLGKLYRDLLQHPVDNRVEKRGRLSILWLLSRPQLSTILQKIFRFTSPFAKLIGGQRMEGIFAFEDYRQDFMQDRSAEPPGSEDCPGKPKGMKST